MKEHAQSSDPSLAVPETLWVGVDLEPILDTDWKTDWVLKPRAGSGYTLFGSGSLRGAIDLEAVRSWRPTELADRYGEWAYSQAEPGYILERRIETADGEEPNDFRFFTFDGVVRMIQVDTPRTKDVERRFYLPDWTPLDVQQGGKKLAPVLPRPVELEQMIAHAERVGQGYDFIRVDLYVALGRIYFGEITPYPAGGIIPFSDPEFDRELGSYWNLVTA